MAKIPDWPVLAQGQKGPNVKALQLLLRYRGASISADGDFGPNTYNAVLNFQSNNGLYFKDGVAGEETLSAIIVTISCRTINSAAQAAQTLLAKFESLAVDGDFYTGSLIATRNFQEAMGIYEPDAYSEPGYGAVDAITWRYLFGYNAYPAGAGGGGGETGGDIVTSGSVYASTAQTNSSLSTSQMTANAKYVLDYLCQKGFTKEAACAVIGNMQAESDVDPGVWEVQNNVSNGYGLVQWTPGSYFLNYASDNGYLSDALPATANAMAENNPKQLMNAELECLVWSCQPGNGRFYSPSSSSPMQHTGYSMSFATFKASTISVETLAIVFHDHYERSNDSATALNRRKEYAKYWYDTL